MNPQRRTFLQCLAGLVGLGSTKALATTEPSLKGGLEPLVWRVIQRETQWDNSAWAGLITVVPGQYHARRIEIVRELEGQAVIVEFCVDSSAYDERSVRASILKAIEQIRASHFRSRGVLRLKLE